MRKKTSSPAQAVPAGGGVGDEGRVGVADVGGVVDVVDRRRQVVAGHAGEARRHLPNGESQFDGWDVISDPSTRDDAGGQRRLATWKPAANPAPARETIGGAGGRPAHHLAGPAAEDHDRPAPLGRGRSQAGVRVDRDRVPHGLEHGQVAGRVAVGVAAGQVVALPVRDLRDGVHLARAVAERPGQLAGVDPVLDDRPGAEPGRHPERSGPVAPRSRPGPPTRCRWRGPADGGIRAASWPRAGPCPAASARWSR